MKKIYFIGLGLTLVLLGTRLGFIYEALTFNLIIKEVILSLLFAHIYLASSYAGITLTKAIFQSWFVELKIIGFWASIIAASFGLGYLYIIGLTHSDVSFFMITGFPMLMTGCLMEYYQQNVIEFTIDKNIEEIKDEDFKIKL